MKRANLGNLRTKFFAYIQTSGKEIVRIGDLQKRLRLTEMQEHNLLKRLAKSGLILRLKRGVYLAAQTLPASGAWQPNEYYLIAKFMEVLGAEYYIGGTTAIHQYHFTTQIPNQFTVYNNKLSGIKRIGQLRIQFIKTATSRLGGSVEYSVPHKNIKVNFASLARTLLDSVNDWSRYNSLPDAYKWMRSCIKDQSTIDELIIITKKYANKSTLRRIGYILEKVGVSETKLKPLIKKYKASQDWVVLDPTGGYKGATNKKWGIIDNVND